MNTNAVIRGKNRRNRNNFLKFMAFTGPHAVIFVIFVLIPIFYGLYISLTKWDFVSPPDFVGFANYQNILFDTASTYHKQFIDGLLNTLKFVALNVPLAVIIPFILAYLLNVGCRWNRFFQSSLYIPTLFSITAVGIVWMQLLNKRYGLVSAFNVQVTLNSQLPYAWYSLIGMSIWWTMGSNMVIYQAALAGVSRDLYESASLDGAGFFQKAIHVAIPSIRFQLLFTLVTTIAGSFNVYGQPAILTQTGIGGTPKIWVLTMYIRSLAFGSGQAIAGMASAMSILLGLIIVVFSVLQFKLMSGEQ